MLNFYFRRIWRNKWLIVKMFIISPLISILPIILMNQFTNDISQDRILCMCVWSFIYFSVFENVNMKMKDNVEGKMYDLLMAKNMLFLVNFFEKTALIISFLPSFFITLFSYSILYNLKFDFYILFFSFVGMIFFTLVLMDFTLVLNLSFKNYFNKFNVSMSVIYFLAGVLYPIGCLPKVVSWFSALLPVAFLFDFIYSRKITNFYIFLVMICVWYIFIKILLSIAEERFRRLGGVL